MKIMLLATLMLTSLNALASDQKFVCYSDEIDKSVVLESLGAAQDTDLEDWEYKVPYKISIQTTELAFADFESEGFAYGEDVLLFFDADKEFNGEKVSFHIYLDELDQSSLILGEKSYQFDCDYQ